jgi:hypothetical protein
MVKSAVRFSAGQEEGDFARGDSLRKHDRSVAEQRSRQVAPVTDENFIGRIAKCKPANFKLTFRIPQFAIRNSFRRLSNAKSYLSPNQPVDR